MILYIVKLYDDNNIIKLNSKKDIGIIFEKYFKRYRKHIFFIKCSTIHYLFNYIFLYESASNTYINLNM